jgi:hypothetical protein
MRSADCKTIINHPGSSIAVLSFTLSLSPLSSLHPMGYIQHHQVPL